MPLLGCVECTRRAAHHCDFCGQERVFRQSRDLEPTHPLVAWLVADSPRERAMEGVWRYEVCSGCKCEGPVFVPQSVDARAA